MATGTIHDTWAGYHIPGGGPSGMTIHSSISIHGYVPDGSNPVILGYWFHSSDGKPRSYFEVFDIPRDATKEKSKRILDRKYDYYRGRVTRPNLSVRHGSWTKVAVHESSIPGRTAGE